MVKTVQDKVTHNHGSLFRQHLARRTWVTCVGHLWVTLRRPCVGHLRFVKSNSQRRNNGQRNATSTCPRGHLVPSAGVTHRMGYSWVTPKHKSDGLLLRPGMDFIHCYRIRESSRANPSRLRDNIINHMALGIVCFGPLVWASCVVQL